MAENCVILCGIQHATYTRRVYSVTAIGVVTSARAWKSCMFAERNTYYDSVPCRIRTLPANQPLQYLSTGNRQTLAILFSLFQVCITSRYLEGTHRRRSMFVKVVYDADNALGTSSVLAVYSHPLGRCFCVKFNAL